MGKRREDRIGRSTWHLFVNIRMKDSGSQPLRRQETWVQSKKQQGHCSHLDHDLNSGPDT